MRVTRSSSIAAVLSALMVLTAAPALAIVRRVPGHVNLPAQALGTTADVSFDYSQNQGLSEPTFTDIETVSFEVPSTVAGLAGPETVNIYVEVTKPKGDGRFP